MCKFNLIDRMREKHYQYYHIVIEYCGFLIAAAEGLEWMKMLSVADTVWPWKDDGASEKREKAAVRKKKSVIEASVALTAGALLFLFYSRVAGGIVMCMGTLLLIGGQFVPPVYYGFRWLVMLLGRGVGIGLTWILLVPFFYLCFPFGHLLIKISGRDPMTRKLDKNIKSYWEKHELPKDRKRYEKLY